MKTKIANFCKNSSEKESPVFWSLTVIKLKIYFEQDGYRNRRFNRGRDDRDNRRGDRDDRRHRDDRGGRNEGQTRIFEITVDYPIWLHFAV